MPINRPHANSFSAEKLPEQKSDTAPADDIDGSSAASKPKARAGTQAGSSPAQRRPLDLGFAIGISAVLWAVVIFAAVWLF